MRIPVVNKTVDSTSFWWGVGAAALAMIVPKVSDYVAPLIVKARQTVQGVISK